MMSNWFGHKAGAARHAALIVVLAIGAGPDNFVAAQCAQPVELPTVGDDSGFGEAVDISGDYAIAGLPFAIVNGVASGAAVIYRFDHSSGQWRIDATLTPPNGADDDWFGLAVSIDGEFAVCGAPKADRVGADSGAVYVPPHAFRRMAAAGRTA